MARPRRDQNSRMLPVKDRQFGAFTVLVFHTVVFLALIHSCRGQSEIIGPSQPVVATVGEDIILPGYLDPVMNAFDMTVEWARPDLDPRFVLVWRDGVELESKKHPSYEGRTSLFTDELKHGNISLKLSKVKISDEGRYRCFIPTLSGASTVQLVVVPSTPGTPGTPDTTGTPGTRGTPGTPGTPGSLYFIMGSTIGFAALVSIPAVVFVVWKWRNKKFKNKRRSHEDGPEQTEEEKTVTSKGDNTRFHAVMEGEGEGVPLMAGRQEETTVDNGGEEKIESQSERKVPQFVAETHQHQLGTKPEPIRDMDRAVGEWGMKSVTDEKVSLIPAEGETHLKQDMIGRQVQNDGDKGEGEQTMKPVKGDSGLPMVLVGEGQKEQLHNLHTDQEVHKQQEPMNDVDKKEANIKKKNKQERAKKGGSGSTGQKKQRENQREQMQLEAESQRAENERTRQSEKQNRKEVELKPQKGNVNQHLLEDQKQEGSKAELEDKKGKDRDQSNITRMTERKAENQKQQINEKLEEAEEKRDGRENKLSSDLLQTPPERAERKNQEPQEENELQAEKQQEKSLRNQEETKEQPERSTNRVKEECKGRQEETTVDNGGEEKIESQSERKVPQFVAERETHQHQLGTKPEPIRDMDRAEGEQGMKSVTDEKVSLIPAEGETHLKQDMIGRQVQNDGDKGEGEQTMKPVKGDSGLPMVLVGEGQKEQLHNLHTDQEVQKEEETQKQGQLQAVQQPNRRPQTQRNVKRGEKVQLREKELHVDQQQAVRKRRRQDEGKEETQKTKKPKEQNKGETNIEQEVQMEDEGEANIEQEENMDVEGEANREQEEKMEVEANREQEVKDEPQKCDMNSQLGQAHVCQENQQVEPMDS